MFIHPTRAGFSVFPLIIAPSTYKMAFAPVDATYVLKTLNSSLANAVLFDDEFALKDTDDLDEGASNFYYTDARFDARFALSNLANLGTKSHTSLTDIGTNTHAQIDAALLGVAPVGSIFMYGAAAAPTGYLLCDGTAVSRTTYAALFAVIGTTFGAGDGSTTFNLPNMTGRYAVGLPSAGTLGASAGTALTNGENRAVGQHTHTFTGSSTTTETESATHTHNTVMGSHTHTFHFWNATRAAGGSGSMDYLSNSPPNAYNYDRIVATDLGTKTSGTESATHTHALTPLGSNANAGDVAGTNAPYIQLNFIIKY